MLVTFSTQTSVTTIVTFNFRILVYHVLRTCSSISITLFITFTLKTFHSHRVLQVMVFYHGYKMIHPMDDRKSMLPSVPVMDRQVAFVGASLRRPAMFERTIHQMPQLRSHSTFSMIYAYGSYGREWQCKN